MKRVLLFLCFFAVPAYASAAGTVTINGLSPSDTVKVGVTVFFNAGAIGFTNPVFSLYDSFAGSSITGDKINAFGGFVWTPRTQDIGSHKITVTATDPDGTTASADQSITVSAPATASITDVVGTSTTPGSKVSFSVTTANYSSPTYTISDSFQGSSVLPIALTSAGKFEWTPTRYDIGTHTFTVNVSDASGNSATLTQTIEVKPAYMTLSGIAPNSLFGVGDSVTFNADTVGLTNPQFSVGDSFNNSSVSKATVSASGTVVWVPQESDKGAHYITVRAMDNNAYQASASISLQIGSATSTALKKLSVKALAAAKTKSTSTLPTFNTNYRFTKLLTLGSNSGEVLALQKALIARNFMEGEATGYFGRVTQAAVVKYQLYLGLEPVGYVGSQTRRALNDGK